MFITSEITLFFASLFTGQLAAAVLLTDDLLAAKSGEVSLSFLEIWDAVKLKLRTLRCWNAAQPLLAALSNAVKRQTESLNMYLLINLLWAREQMLEKWKEEVEGRQAQRAKPHSQLCYCCCCCWPQSWGKIKCSLRLEQIKFNFIFCSSHSLSIFFIFSCPFCRLFFSSSILFQCGDGRHFTNNKLVHRVRGKEERRCSEVCCCCFFRFFTSLHNYYCCSLLFFLAA